MSIKKKLATAVIAGVFMIGGAPVAMAQSSGVGPVIDSYDTKQDEAGRGTIYSVTPTQSGRNVSSADAMSYDPLPELGRVGIPQQINLGGQLVCHMLFAKTKPQWNLEDWRPEVSLSQYIASQCNP